MILRNIEYALILGKGKSGLAAQSLLKNECIKYKILNDSDLNISDFYKLCKQQRFSHCIISPGFSKFHPWIKIINDLKIYLVPEIELGWSRFNSKTIAVSGSNGKSTALKLLYDSLKDNFNVSIGGNYGIPACSIALNECDSEWTLLEVSSFQLEHVKYFTPDIAMIINIYPNHLDRYGSLEDYFITKCKLFGSQENLCSSCIIPYNQKDVFEKHTDIKRNWITFGCDRNSDYRSFNNKIFKGEDKIADLSSTLFDHKEFLLSTAPATAAVLDKSKISLSNLENAVKYFEILPHRFEFIAKHMGVNFINDSKATNLHAVESAIKSCSQPIKLLAGGRLKQKNMTFFKEKLAEYKVSLYLYGESASFLNACFSEVVPCTLCTTLYEAFLAACHDAISGDTILLSPGCASFDQFNDYKDRGKQFRLMVKEHIEDINKGDR